MKRGRICRLVARRLHERSRKLRRITTALLKRTEMDAGIPSLRAERVDEGLARPGPHRPQLVVQPALRHREARRGVFRAECCVKEKLVDVLDLERRITLHMRLDERSPRRVAVASLPLRQHRAGHADDEQ